MGRIKELINKFIQPKEQEKSFEEIALASGMTEIEIKELKGNIQGINWSKFAREDIEISKKAQVREIKQKEHEISNLMEEKSKIKGNDEIER